MIKQKYKLFLPILFLFLIFSCGKKEVVKEIVPNENEVTINQDNIDAEKLLLLKNDDNLNKYSSKEESELIVNKIYSWSFSEANTIIDNILKKINEKSELTPEDKKTKVNLLYTKIGNLLNEWNYLYKESESFSESKKIIENINSELIDYSDPFYNNYYLWYWEEINKNYTWSLNYYDKALSYSNESNNVTTSIILNQIWHVYDLKWKYEIAYSYYFKAYEKYKKNYKAATNIWRYLAKKWEIEKSFKFFEYWLNTADNTLKSEIYFSLSTLELERNWLSVNIEKSIWYANKSIEYYPEYSMWYVALARWFYMQNNKIYNNSIESNLTRSLELNKNNSYAYEIIWLYEYEKSWLELALKYFESAISVVNNDNRLMNDEKNQLIYELKSKMLLLTLIDVIKSDTKNDMKVVENKFFQLPYWKEFITNQLKRKNKWLLWNVSWVEEYIKNYK